jgi:benzodiazapine receptor
MNVFINTNMKNLKSYLVPFLVTLLFNFACLGIGSIFTTDGVSSDWYINLSKASWTPAGWVFGLSWTIIAISFAGLGAFFYKKDRFLLTFYLIGWLLNILWNPLFFKFQSTFFSGIDILLLLINVSLIARYTRMCYGKIWLLSLPYIIWLIIASSLNWYIVFNN